MAPLATAFVRIRPQLSEAEIRASATRAGEQAGRSMSTGLSRTFKAFAGLGAATGLVEAGRKVMEFADQFEGARARVETNTENIGASFVAVQKPLGDLDTKMSGLGFTITDTENSFAQLVTATRSPAKSLRDVALAADIARGRHVSLDTATQILMRVETGHVAMLGRLGIATRDASGHIFTQQQALDALAKAYGGNAAKFAGTFAGKQAAARAEIQQSATEIGVALLPAFADLANVLAHDVLPPIAELAKWFDRNKSTIEPLVKDVLLLTVMWKGYTLATRAAAAITRIMGGNAVATAAALRTEAAAAETATIANRGGPGGGLPLPGPGGVGALPLFAVGAIPDQKPQNVPQNVQGLLGAEKSILASNPAALKDLQKTFGQNPKLNVAQLTAWVAKWQQATAAIRTTATAENILGSSLQRTAAQIQGHVQHALALRAAQDGLRSAMHAAAQTAADTGRALAGNSDAALANRDAVRNEVAQIFAVIDAMKARGATDAAQANMLDILTQAVETNAIKTYGDKQAVDALLGSLGLIPHQAANAIQAVVALDAVMAEKTGLPGRDIKAGAVGRQGEAQALAAAKASATKIASSFNSGFSPIVVKGAEKAAKSAASKFADVMRNDLQTVRDAIASTQSTLMGFAAFQTSGTDTLGASGTNSDFSAQKREKAAQLEQFARLYGRLLKSGLNADDLHEFVGLGPAAIPAMQALLSAGRAGIRQENALDRRISRASAAVAAHDAASQNYALLHRDLQTLPMKNARALATQLRHMGLVVNIREIDRRNGKRIVTLS